MFRLQILRSSRWLVVGLVLILALLPATALAAPAEATNTNSWQACTAYHTIARGQTLWGIARWYGVNMGELQRANGITNPNYIVAGKVLCIPPYPGSSTQYLVRRGDTLSGIARAYGTTWQCLANYNGISNPSYITAGQVITIVYCGW
ncbi:MAG: LysM domain-containing protein [Anaerolineae bacterium]